MSKTRIRLKETYKAMTNSQPIQTSLPLIYRREYAQRILFIFRAGDSCSIVGVSGMAKSNLFRHLLNPEVRQHYLGDACQSYLFLAVDSHALSELSERAMFDLLLHRLATEARERGVDEATMSRMETLCERATEATNSSAWQQIFSQAVAAVMTTDRTRHLVFLFDQFDEVYETLNPRFFANLRAIRDEFKYRISYVTFTRDELPRLCQAPECGEFYELLSPNVIGLGPYNRDDSWVLLRRVAGRYGVTPAPVLGDRLIALTGGHPGLLKAAYMTILRGNTVLPDGDSEAFQALLTNADVRTECLKLWESIGEDEHETLSDIAGGFQLLESERDAFQLLELKGLATEEKEGTAGVFCDLFRTFVAELAPAKARDLKLDTRSGRVWVEGKAIDKDLTKLEFALLCYLHDRRGEVCTRDEIICALYSEEVSDPDAEISDSRVDTLVGRLREKIEPDRSRPRYVLAIRGRGYKLIVDESKRTPC
jgi:DNA-binding winged helix-turn-helix (wHTH) protein